MDISSLIGCLCLVIFLAIYIYAFVSNKMIALLHSRQIGDYLKASSRKPSNEM